MHTGKEGAFDLQKSSFEVKVGLAEMLKGGAIVDVTSPENARIAEEAGAVSVLATDLIYENGIRRMVDPEAIQKIQEAVSIPVIAECRIGHIVEAQILEALFVDFIGESGALTPVDNEYHIDKHAFRIPFFSSAMNLAEALRRVAEGAALIRTHGDNFSGNITDVVKQLRTIRKEIRMLGILDTSELMAEAKKMGAPYRLVKQVAETGQLPVPLFAAYGIRNAADAALAIRLGAESIFISSAIFSEKNPLKSLHTIVSAVNYFNNPEMLAKIAMGKIPLYSQEHSKIGI